MGILDDGEPSQEELLEMQREEERRREQRQTAAQLAQGAAHDQGEAKPGYWDVLTDADIESGIETYDEHIQALLATEL